MYIERHNTTTTTTTTTTANYQISKMSEKQEKRSLHKLSLREKLASSDKAAVLASLVPAVLTKHERLLRQKEQAKMRKAQQKSKPCKKGGKGGKNKPSKKLKPSAFAKKSCKAKPGKKQKPSAVEKNKEKSDRINVIRDLQRAVERLSSAALEKGIIKRGKKSKSEESLESPNKKAKPEEEKSEKAEQGEAAAVLEEAKEQLLLLCALQKQLKTDLDRAEEREVAFLEAQIRSEAAKVKNTKEGKEFKTNLLELEALLSKARSLQPPLPPPLDDAPPLEKEPWKRQREEQEDTAGAKKMKTGGAADSLHLRDPDSVRRLAESSGSEIKQYLVVAHEKASARLKGQKGYLKEMKGDVAYFHPLGSAVQILSCPRSWIVFIDELQAKTAQRQQKKPCTWIDGDLGEKIYNAFTFKDCEPVPDDMNYALYADQVDAGITECLYRNLPGPGLIVMPASLGCFVTAFTEESHAKVTSGDKPKEGEVAVGAKHKENGGETDAMRAGFLDRICRAITACISIQAGAHWTLLAISRKNKKAANLSTSATNPLGSFDKARRQESEREQFEIEHWPLMEPDAKEEWEIRYYDTLETPSKACLKIATQILDLLRSSGFGVFEQPLLPVKNLLTQHGLTCGLWTLHYIEEEVRFFTGEQRGTIDPDLDYRRERLNAMQQTLLLRSTQKALNKKH